MRKSFCFFIFTLQFCSICSLVKAQNGLGIQHVVLVGVDGLSPDGIRKASTPTLDRMMREGAYSLNARCVTPSSSSSNWASMIMGADVEQHGIHSNDYERDNFILPPVVQGRDEIFPTIFGEIDDQIKGAKIGAIYHWDGFGRLFEKSAVDYDTAATDERAATRLACNFIRVQKPTFTFIHLDHVDHAGHVHGHGSPEYYASVRVADSLIAEILSAVESSGLAKKALVLVSSDHGGIGLGHGGLTMAEMEIPFILWGHKIKKGYQIPTPIYQYDNAATIAFALGLEQPYAWIGRPVSCAFEGFAEPKRNYPVQRFLDKPVFLPKTFENQPPGGLFFEPSTIQLENPNDQLLNTEIRYTLDDTKPNAQSPLYRSPIKVFQNTMVNAAVFKEGKMLSEMATAQYRFALNGQKPTVRYVCYLMDNLKRLPDLSEQQPVSTGRSYEFSSTEVPLPRPQHVVVVFESNIRISKSGKYTFFTRSDDGSKLYIGGKTVVDNDGDHGVQEKSGKIQLEPGLYPIRIEWFNGGGGAWLDASMEGPGFPKQIIPVQVLED